MRTHRSALSLAALTLTLLTAGLAEGGEQPATEAGKPTTGGISSLTGLLGKVALPGLSVLIEPEKLGLLTDNLFGINGNKTNVLSGNTFKVQITIHDAPRKAPKAKKTAEKRHPNRSRKHKASQKHETESRSQGTAK